MTFSTQQVTASSRTEISMKRLNLFLLLSCTLLALATNWHNSLRADESSRDHRSPIKAGGPMTVRSFESTNSANESASGENI